MYYEEFENREFEPNDYIYGDGYEIDIFFCFLFSFAVLTLPIHKTHLFSKRLPIKS